jgi:hypothetical protein
MASSTSYLNARRVTLFYSYSGHALFVAHVYLVIIVSNLGCDGYVLLHLYQQIRSVMTSFYLLEIWFNMCIVRPCKRVEGSDSMISIGSWLE